jgi:hypothetical protein
MLTPKCEPQSKASRNTQPQDRKWREVQLPSGYNDQAEANTTKKA